MKAMKAINRIHNYRQYDFVEQHGVDHIMFIGTDEDGNLSTDTIENVEENVLENYIESLEKQRILAISALKNCKKSSKNYSY